MKQIFTTLFILFLTVQSQAQCYPVLTKMKKQTQYYSDEAYDRNFPYFYRATNLYVSGGALMFCNMVIGMATTGTN